MRRAGRAVVIPNRSVGQRRAIMVLGISLALFAGCWGMAAQSGPAQGGDVLLTFDTEFEDDAASITALAINVPSTYFWTGSYARKYPDLLRRLASQGHTIGAHSFYHDDLTTLDAGHLQFDLEQVKQVLEDISQVPVTAFRAPYLTYDDRVMAVVEDLGFLIDSSEESPWPHNRRLPEVAVSVFENLLISDYDIFDSLGLDDATALDFLLRAYANHAARGQPFVMLLHPRIINRHASVIHDFIAHVRNDGGTFQTMNGYLGSLANAPKAGRTGIWVDLDADANVDALLAEAASRAATDVFLSLPDVFADRPGGPTLAAAAVAAIRRGGLRVHLAYPVTQNRALARLSPETVMLNASGRPDPGWVSPSHPKARRQLIAKAGDLVAKLGVDGLFLYGLGYPGLNRDFSPAALQRFSAATAVSGVTPSEILSAHYLIWTKWRSSETALLVEEIAAAARARRGTISISVSMPSEAATDFRMQELSGLDFHRIGAAVDAIILSTSLSFGWGTSSLPRNLLAARTQAGSVPLFVGTDMPDRQRSTGHHAAPARPAIRSLLALSAGTIVDIRAAKEAMPRFRWPDLSPVPARKLVENDQP